jgi:cation-transporting ATPase 13A3/4/5
MLGLQIVILLLVIAYYFILNRAQIEEDTPNLRKGWAKFTDASQALYAFEIAWAIGFVWVIVFKRPQSIFASFLRRCSLDEATYVAIFVPDVLEKKDVISEEVSQSKASIIFRTIYERFDSCLAFLFSEPNTGVPGQTEYVKVQFDKTKYIEFRLRRYHYDATMKCFHAAEIDVAGTAAQLYELRGGLSSEQVVEREATVGGNVITMGEPSFFFILFKEFTRIFYVYQNFMTWTWLNYAYWHMGIVNTLVYTFGGVVVSFVKYKNEVRLRELSKISGTVTVLRNGKFVDIEQTHLVPGDVVSISAGVVYCDMVILTGEALVDESSLTGESMPIVKTALDPLNPVPYDAIHHHKHHSVFAGTTVIDESEKKESDVHKNLALVVRTGSHTMKGELLRDILFGKPVKFKFDVEVNFVLLILLCYAIFGFAMTIYFLKSDPVYGFFYAIYVVASALPPLLPTVFVVSEGISADRLLEKRVAVSDTHRILMAGKVRVAFFDKTGTLTEQGLDFHSVVTVTDNHFDEPSVDPPELIGRAMGVCHSVKKVKQNGVDTFIGNSIDRKMFEASRKTLENGHGAVPDSVTDESGAKFSILKQFDFDSKRKTQTCIVRDESNGSLLVFSKGTGEAVKKMSLSVPANFEQLLIESAKSGLYQISICYRQAEPGILEMSRDEIERNMHFLGFINFSNRMKASTPSMIRQLVEGDIRTIMISGDHVLTAIHIARLAGMIHEESQIVLGRNVSSDGVIEWVDENTGNPVELPSISELRTCKSYIELAMSGHVWEHLITKKPEEAKLLAHFIRVIGRCSPGDKISMVDCFNKQGFITLMCGDGGNDCGALRTAHVGIALSDAEASVVSPFTSLDKNIMSVVDVLKEGRCTLSSAISSYKYMIMYGQVETINQMVCAWFSITFSEWCWVFMDGFWVITMAFSLPFAEVSEKLAPERPTSSILGPHTLVSTIGVLIINFLFTVLALGLLNQQSWYKCRKWEEGAIADVTSIGDNYESSVIFIVSGYQYISSAMAYNFGFKHRAAWIYNWRFVCFCIIWSTIHFVVVLYPSTLSCFFRVNCDNDNALRGATSDEVTPIQNPWNTTVIPKEFRGILLTIIIMNAVATSIWEYFIVNGPVAEYLKRRYRKENKLLGGVGYLGAKLETTNTSDGVQLVARKVSPATV